MYDGISKHLPCVSVERVFRARHAVTINGEEESMHEHDWMVVIEVAGELDEEGLLVDFHLLEVALDQALQPFAGGDFNGTPPFDDLNPSAELIASHLIHRVMNLLPESASGRIKLARAILREAPGCHATCYWGYD